MADPNPGAPAAAFVVWLDARGPAGLGGQVEHVSTARRRRFASSRELIAILEQAAASLEPPDAAGRSDPAPPDERPRPPSRDPNG